MNTSGYRNKPGRRVALLTAIVLGISLIFPISAAAVRSPEALPSWWGVLDVVVAAILAVLVIYIAARFDKGVGEEIRKSSYRAYRVMVNLVLVLLVIFLIAGDRLTWTYFLPGIAWRFWLAFYAFPPWLAAYRS